MTKVYVFECEYAVGNEKSTQVLTSLDEPIITIKNPSTLEYTCNEGIVINAHSLHVIGGDIVQSKTMLNKVTVTYDVRAVAMHKVFVKDEDILDIREVTRIRKKYAEESLNNRNARDLNNKLLDNKIIKFIAKMVGIV